MLAHGEVPGDVPASPDGQGASAVHQQAGWGEDRGGGPRGELAVTATEPLIPSQWAGFAPLPLLTLINYFNYLDRQIMYGLFPLVKEDMQLTDMQLGALGFGNLLVFALSSIIGGPITDRIGPRKVIFAGVAIWSFATVGSALAPSFWVLLVMRALVGVGEGAFGPAGNALLCADAPPEKRGRAMGIYNVGMALGGASGGTLGLLAGGALSPLISWRGALMIAAAPGLLLAILALFMKAPARVEREVLLPARAYLLAPTYVLCLLGGILGTFGGGAMIAWVPTLLLRERHFDANFSALYIAAMAIGCGAGGVLAGGYAGDALSRRARGGHALAVGISFLLAFPVGIAALFAPGAVSFCILTAVAGFLLSVYNGPVAAAVDDLGPRRYAATLQAWFLLGIHLFGNTPSPIVTGWLSDRLQGHTGSPLAWALVPAMCAFLASGILFVAVARRQQTGTAHA